MKKIIPFLAVILAVGGSLTARATNEKYPDFYDELNAPEVVKQRQAVEAHAFFEDNLPRNNDGSYDYPDEYAGEYIDDDGNLILQISDNNYSDYKYLTDKYSCVMLETVDYSLDYLNETITDFIEENPTIMISSSYIDVIDNVAVVEISDYSIEHIEHKNNIPLRIEYTEKTAYTCSRPVYTNQNIYGGTTLQTSNLFADNFSAAAYVKNSSGDDCILTCGHGLRDGQTVWCNGSPIGTVECHQYSNNETGDYSLINLEDREYGRTAAKAMGKLITNISASSDLFNVSSSHTLVKNQYCFKYSEINGFSRFKVDEVNVNEYFDNTTKIKGLTRCSVQSGNTTGGDSGCGVFYYYDSTQIGKYYFCGVIAAEGINKNTGEQFMWLTPYETIANATGIELQTIN